MGEGSIEQRPDMRFCIVKRVLDGMKEYKGDGSQKRAKPSRRNVELQEVRQI